MRMRLPLPCVRMRSWDKVNADSNANGKKSTHIRSSVYFDWTKKIGFRRSPANKKPKQHERATNRSRMKITNEERI